MLEGKGKFYITKQTRHGVGYIHISREVVSDSQFPFRHKDKLEISILPDGLLIKKAE